jgi:hypothetical protein
MSNSGFYFYKNLMSESSGVSYHSSASAKFFSTNIEILTADKWKKSLVRSDDQNPSVRSGMRAHLKISQAMSSTALF